MYLVIEENPNCEPEERKFKELGSHKKVRGLHLEMKDGKMHWCDVMGVDENGSFIDAQASQIEDSGAGIAWLIFGGTWGIRFRKRPDQSNWDLKNNSQWGVPFKVLDSSGVDIEF